MKRRENGQRATSANEARCWWPQSPQKRHPHEHILQLVKSHIYITRYAVQQAKYVIPYTDFAKLITTEAIKYVYSQ